MKEFPAYKLEDVRKLNASDFNRLTLIVNTKNKIEGQVYDQKSKQAKSPRKQLAPPPGFQATKEITKG